MRGSGGGHYRRGATVTWVMLQGTAMVGASLWGLGSDGGECLPQCRAITQTDVVHRTWPTGIIHWSTIRLLVCWAETCWWWCWRVLSVFLTCVDKEDHRRRNQHPWRGKRLDAWTAQRVGGDQWNAARLWHHQVRLVLICFEALSWAILSLHHSTRVILTNHFSGPGRVIRQVHVCVSVFLQKNNF